MLNWQIVCFRVKVMDAILQEKSSKSIQPFLLEFNVLEIVPIP